MSRDKKKKPDRLMTFTEMSSDIDRLTKALSASQAEVARLKKDRNELLAKLSAAAQKAEDA